MTRTRKIGRTLELLVDPTAREDGYHHTTVPIKGGEVSFSLNVDDNSIHYLTFGPTKAQTTNLWLYRKNNDTEWTTSDPKKTELTQKEKIALNQELNRTYQILAQYLEAQK